MKKTWRLILTLTLLILLGGISRLQERAARSAPAAAPATVAIVRASSWPVSDAEVEAMVRQAVALAGGLESVITPGDTVLLKPNLVWGAAPSQGYTTDPRVVRALVLMAREAGAAQVLIADGAALYRDGHDGRGATVEAFRLCGYDASGDMVDDVTGAPLLDLNDAGGLDQHDPALVTRVEVANGLIWSEYWLPRAVMEADVVIGVPVLKNHTHAGVTLALKGQIGIAPSDIYHSPGAQMYKMALHHGPADLGRHIVDLNLARPLDFAVIDGLRGMIDGPVGGTLANPPMRLIIAGRDAVAVDTVGALVMGYDPATIPYLGWAAGAGLGTADTTQITVRGTPVSQVRRDFPAPYGDPPAQRAERTPPTVQLTTPADGLVVSDQVLAWASAQDNRAVAKVEFFVDDELQAVVTAPPYQATLDMSAYRGQQVTVRAVAYDRALNDAADEATVAVVPAPAPGTATLQTATLTIPTYPYAGCLQTHSNGPYLYLWLDWNCYGNPAAPTPRPYTLLVLENDFLRVTLLPELGGRVYQMIFKPTGHNELYQNPVLKPTHWGPPEQGWWLAAGGIEWGLPVDEHGYEWGVPWSWSAITSTAGVTVTLRDTNATNRLRAQIDVFLPADQAVLEISPRLENPTDATLSYKYWSNAMLAPGAANTVGPNLRFVFHADQMAVHSTGDCRLPGCWPTVPTGPAYRFNWPIHNGVDFSRLGNWRQWLGFFEYPQAAADWIGVYDTSADEGVVRLFPPEVARGAKGFAFGWSDPIDWHNWTDDGSAYVELHGGVAPTFWDTASLGPGQALRWTERWYPVSGRGVLSAATAEAAIGLSESGGELRVAVQPTRMHAAGETSLHVWNSASCAELGRWDLPAVGPGQPLVVSLLARAADVTVAYVDRQGNLLAATGAVDCMPPRARVTPLPPWVGTATFTVTWSGQDWSGIAAYDVQFRDGYEGAWTDWLTETLETTAPFTGTHGHSYFFRTRARDVLGNQGRWEGEEWGQAFTTVLVEPAAVLVTSRKTAAPSIFRPDQTVAYTVWLSNSGNLPAAAVLTDTLPATMELLTATLTASSGPPPTFDGSAIRWAGSVEAGSAVRITYLLAPTASTPTGVPLTNTAVIEGSVLGPLVRRATAVQGYVYWLPVIANNGQP